jgi:hypothetical protein
VSHLSGTRKCGSPIEMDGKPLCSSPRVVSHSLYPQKHMVASSNTFTALVLSQGPAAILYSGLFTRGKTHQPSNGSHKKYLFNRKEATRNEDLSSTRGSLRFSPPVEIGREELPELDETD